MSNFLFVVHDTRHDARVDAWLARHAASSDVHRERMGRRRLVIVSKDVARSVRGTEFFRGSLVSTEHRCIVFGPDGWRDAPAAVRADPGAHSGEYIAASWASGRLSVDRDVFGQPRLAHTRAAGLIAASDSLLVLASLRRAVGARVSVNEEVVLARAARSAIATQQFSTETLIDEIRYVPASRGLTQSRHLLRWELTGPLMADRIRTDRDPVELLRASASEVGSIVQTLARVDAWTTTLSLSGGLDSRVVLAGAVAADVVDDIFLYTKPSGGDPVDREIAFELMAAVGSAQKPGGGPRPPSAEDPLTLWAASLLGLYDGFGPRRRPLERTRDFGLTGIGAEIHKGNWEWRTIAALAAKAAPEGAVHDALESQLRKGAASVGAEPDRENASELVYLGYRNGIHASAGHIGVHMTGLHPVMQLDLARAGHQRRDGRFGSDQGIIDMTLLLAPPLVSERYDLPERDRSPAQAQARLAELGGPLEPIQPMRVHGDPDDVVAGPSSLAMSIARSFGFEGTIAETSVLPMFDRAIDHFRDAALRRTFEQARDDARWRADKGSADLLTSERSATRALMLHAIAAID